MSTQATLLRNSLWYAAAASTVATLSADAADAQVVYTDVDPDVSVTDGQFNIDFDGDGDPELSILESTQNRDQVLVGTDPESADFVDGIIGNGFPYGTNTYAYVLPVASSADISDANSDFVLLADYQLPGQATFTFGGADPNGWLSAGDAYVGLRFQLGEGTQHYAWVRVNVEQAGVVRVLDYAFESTPDTPIAAGDQGAPPPPPPPPPPPTATEPDALGEGYAFTPVAPNPVTGRSTFDLMVGRTQHVRVTVVDALGREVRTLHDGALASGAETEIAFDSASLPTGIYVVRVVGESFDSTRTVSVVR